MITPLYVKTMARYNAWQNDSLYTAADTLDEAARNADTGAVFHSIHKTLCHLLWGDQLWMHRFAGFPQPPAAGVQQSLVMIEEWEVLKVARRETDQAIIQWGETVCQDFLDGELSWYSGSQKRDYKLNTGKLVTHMFNHQTHHRGQVHAMLTAAGCSPDDTDLFIMVAG